MSNYSVVAEVSEVLKQMLWEEFQKDSVIRAFVNNVETIGFKNPTETLRDPANRLSLWLYQVTENEYVKNQPPVRAGETQQRGKPRDFYQLPPMALNLYYLVTPFAPDGKGDHLLLGKTLQVMYDNAVVLLQNNTGQIYEELRISFCRLTLEELSRIWEALRESYRLSVCYQVRVAHIDSGRREDYARIIRQDSRYGERDAVEAELQS